MEKFKAYCPFFDCLPYGIDDQRRGNCPHCRFWIDSEEKKQEIEKKKWDLLDQEIS